MMGPRLIVLASCFVAAAFMGQRAMRPEQIPLREPLSQLPNRIGPWTGVDEPPLAPDVAAVLGVDEYDNRLYTVPVGAPVSLYVGYYASQRQGDAIHSPLNCLPGAGWQPMSRAYTTIAVPGHPDGITVNSLIIQKGLDRQAVLYWYQSHGRVVASEYWSKAYLIWDALHSNRSDAALVRVISPVVPQDTSETASEQRAIDFVKLLFPRLERFLPS